MAVVVRSGTLVGVDGEAVAVEVDLLRRLPAVVVVGLASAAVRESADRVRSAIQEARFDFPKLRVVVNLAPADLRKDGSAFDLPIAVGVLAASLLLLFGRGWGVMPLIGAAALVGVARMALLPFLGGGA